MPEGAGKAVVCMALACAMLAGCGEETESPTSTKITGIPPWGYQQVLTGCQTFAGIGHCTIGGTAFLLGGALTVARFAAAGIEGVSSATGTMHGWSQMGTIDFPDAGGGSIAFTATSGGSALGGATIAQGTPARSLSVGPNFPGGGACGIKVYNNGVEQARQEEIDGNGEPCRIVIDENVGGFTYQDVEAGIIVIGDTSIRFSLELVAGMMTVTLPNGTVVTGNRIVLEAPLAPGSATTFDTVDVTGLLDSYSIVAESVVP